MCICAFVICEIADCACLSTLRYFVNRTTNETTAFVEFVAIWMCLGYSQEFILKQNNIAIALATNSKSCSRKRRSCNGGNRGNLIFVLNRLTTTQQLKPKQQIIFIFLIPFCIILK